MPEKGTMLMFKHHERSERVPFIIYADTEALIKEMHNCDPNPQNSYTKKYQKHELAFPIILNLLMIMYMNLNQENTWEKMQWKNL